MNERILGKELSTYKATSISLGQSKNDNSDGIKSRFVALTLKDKYSIGAKPVRHVLFEDEVGTNAFEELMQCRSIGADGKPIVDPKNGYVVDTAMVAKRSAERIQEDANIKKMMQDDDKPEDPLMLDKLLKWEGGMTQPYKFPTGPRYGNDANGNPTKDKDGNQIVKSEIDVFVQVKDVVIKEDGTRDYTYVNGMNPSTRGERIMRTFFKKAATSTADVPIEEAEVIEEVTGPGF